MLIIAILYRQRDLILQKSLVVVYARLPLAHAVVSNAQQAGQPLVGAFTLVLPRTRFMSEEKFHNHLAYNGMKAMCVCLHKHAADALQCRGNQTES